jgi:hypothetical protein
MAQARDAVSRGEYGEAIAVLHTREQLARQLGDKLAVAVALSSIKRACSLKMTTKSERA